MLQIVLDAIVNIRHFGYIEDAVFVPKVLLQLGPPAGHQLPGFAVIQHGVVQGLALLVDVLTELLDEVVDVSAASHRIRYELERVGDGNVTARIQPFDVLGAEFPVLLHHFVQFGLYSENLDILIVLLMVYDR